MLSEDKAYSTASSSASTAVVFNLVFGRRAQFHTPWETIVEYQPIGKCFDHNGRYVSCSALELPLMANHSVILTNVDLMGTISDGVRAWQVLGRHNIIHAIDAIGRLSQKVSTVAGDDIQSATPIS